MPSMLCDGDAADQYQQVPVSWRTESERFDVRRGSGCNDGSLPRDPAGPPYSRPHCFSLHTGPLGVCRRFADRSLSVFVIEGLPGPQNEKPRLGEITGGGLFWTLLWRSRERHCCKASAPSKMGI